MPCLIEQLASAMSAQGMKAQQGPYQSSLLSQFFVIICILLFLGTRFVNCVTDNTTRGESFYYEDGELLGLQTLWKAWNGTQDPNSNLAGWGPDPSQKYPCQSLFLDGEMQYHIWRGVQCIRKCSSTNISSCSINDVYVIGLALSNASITGYLPDVAIGSLASLATLVLTGNPNLSGELPIDLQALYLNTLDLHDNAFSGTIPAWNILWNLLYLDLSGNQLTGLFPYSQTRIMGSVEVLRLGRNQFQGVIPEETFYNMSKLETLDISHNSFIGVLPNFTNNIKLLNLDASGNQFDGPLPDLTKCSTLHTVNLGGNHLTGNITSLSTFLDVNAATVVNLSYTNTSIYTRTLSWTASDLGSIEELYLDGNGIEGVLDVIQILAEQNRAKNSSIGKLRIVSLMNNRITSVKYNTSSIDNNITVFKLQGNPYCTGKDVDSHDGKRCFCKQNCFNTSAASPRIIIISASTSVAAVTLIFLIVVGAILLKNRRYKQYLRLKFEKKFEEFDVKPTIYSYNELRVATRDFHEENKLGQGGYGAVYKGILPNGQIVAVKQLFMKTAQGLDEFSNEIVLITGMKHRNLVNLKGCCLRETSRILVYEYVDNFDVDQILLGPERQVVSWPVRLKICLGIARGLNYLHADARPRVIHRDIKASNILLDKNLEPKIADFGLALLFPDEQSHILTIHVAGTKGYMAPEYASFGHLSDKVDVYSFGVLVLEIICGRRNILESLPINQIYLSQWAWELHEENRIMELVDPSLQMNEEEEADVARVIKLALLCIQNAGERRPTMARIVSILQNDTQSDVTVLSGAGELLKRSYLSRKSLKLDNALLATVSEESSSSSSSSAVTSEKRRRRGQDLTIDIELSEIHGR